VIVIVGWVLHHLIPSSSSGPRIVKGRARGRRNGMGEEGRRNGMGSQRRLG
jgi:hypothetical protein